MKIGLRNWRKCVEHAIEDLALAQPFLLRHALALVQVAADGEGAVTGSGQDGDAHGGAGRDGLENLDQLCRQFRRDGVVGMRPVEGDDRHAPAGDVLDEYELFRLRDIFAADGNRVVCMRVLALSGHVILHMSLSCRLFEAHGSQSQVTSTGFRTGIRWYFSAGYPITHVACGI